MKKLALIALTSLLGACSLLPQKSVSGTFHGTLPCPDCEKIEAELVLNKDNTYEYNTIYFKKGKEYPFSEKGKFSWNKTKENVIYLENSGNLALQVNETYAELCDANGNTVKDSSHYKLLKITPKSQ